MKLLYNLLVILTALVNMIIFGSKCERTILEIKMLLQRDAYTCIRYCLFCEFLGCRREYLCDDVGDPFIPRVWKRLALFTHTMKPWNMAHFQNINLHLKYITRLPGTAYASARGTHLKADTRSKCNKRR